MINKIKKISIVLVSYNSSKKLVKFIKKIPKQTPILIIDNSKDFKLKKIFKKNKNISIYFKKNEGYGASINYAVKKIKTEYFFVVQPDVRGITKNSLITFYNYAKRLNDKFSVIGPHFKKAPKRGHFQTNLKFDIKKIHNVHGSTIFFNKKVFLKNHGFDTKIFLYWEETDFTKRALKKGYYAYQLNKVKVIHEKGKAVDVKNIKEEQKLIHLYSWHFIWSKFYFFKKHYGKVFALIYFIPTLLRILFRITYYKLTNNNKFLKYYYRLNGVLSSILEKKSFMRLNKIKLHTM
tara:strand:- start:1597 stop:2472 length:876 start_codon:yes stop_codon:yes gene_type:complete